MKGSEKKMDAMQDFSKLLLASMGGESVTMSENEKRIPEFKDFTDLSDSIWHLSASISRMRAVAQCFDDEFVDRRGNSSLAVALNEDHFKNLFYAMYLMIIDIDEKASVISEEAGELHKIMKDEKRWA